MNIQKISTNEKQVEPEQARRENLAALYRLYSKFGWTDLNQTHAAARVPNNPSHFFIKPDELLMEEVTASSLAIVNLNGDQVNGDLPVNRAGALIHAAILGARPEINYSAHTHSRAGAAVSGGAFWRLLVGTLVMVIGGYLGEAGMISVLLGFIIGLIGWAVIIWEIFRGEASQAATTKESVTSAFNAMRLIVLVGWAIYPLGYVFGLMMGSVDADTLNWIYNLADFINKILFGLIIWAAATKDSVAEA